MNILWYNTWSLPFITSNSYINKLTDYILENVVKYDIDIIALCEVFDYYTRKNYIYLIKNALQDWEVINNGNIKRWNFQVSSGILIFYRDQYLDVLNIKNHILNNASMVDVLAAKSMIGIYIYDKQLKKKQWICFTHLQNSNASGKNYCLSNTLKQFNECILTINKWNIYNDSILCIGDFNLEPNFLPKSLLQKNDLYCLHTNTSTTNDNKIYDYIICSAYNSNKFELLLVDDKKNISDHRLLIIQTKLKNIKDKKKIKLNQYKNLPDNTKFYISFILLIIFIYQYMNIKK